MDWLSIKEFLKDTLKYIIFIVIVLFLAVYVLGLQRIVGSSMSPNLKNDDIVLLDKFSYRVKDIKRGDIVALYYADSQYFVKRVIGLPGEKVEFKDNKLYINDKVINESYLKDVKTEDFNLSELDCDIIPEDKYLVLGDNRENSQDSRDKKVGLIPKKNIIGKAFLRIWPLNKIHIISSKNLYNE